MTKAEHDEETEESRDTIVWGFFRSEFAGPIYVDWPIDRRLDGYLLHHGPAELLIDGSAYDELLEQVMANIGLAQRKGILPPIKEIRHD
ncbi:hypothetical protein AU190_20480 [Mycolicibacterium acapulense]|uniref:Uncharacterized protein n=1 Tax=Mycobacterium lehmannii TaxID=2048550 RepID=A0A117JHS9_9MYCO|nr:hypothetical protein [Mycobacterium lehmannii]KUI09172.1 hypothetical protein AU192_17215 [Mycobacterium lehmannii]KUI10491.1 hypothetical protein AU190_20480 [Mycolicibacterium acapulense]KUI12648.1 hypothetical protein AU191_20695 [Mycolicibacterium acapulense]